VTKVTPKVTKIGSVLSDPYAKIRNRKLGDSQMIIKNCKVCGTDIKLKKELKINIALSCYPCLKKEAINYQLISLLFAIHAGIKMYQL
jgi:hypothetical protein